MTGINDASMKGLRQALRGGALLLWAFVAGAGSARALSFVEHFDNALGIQSSTNVALGSGAGHPTGALSGYINASDPGLVFAFRFDQPPSSSGVYVDVSANANTAACAGCGYVPDDHLSGSVSLPQSASLVVSSSAALGSITTNRAFTFSTWVKPAQAISGALFSHNAGSDWGGSKLKYTLAVNAGLYTNQTFYLRDPANTNNWIMAGANGTFSPGQWTHLAFSYSATSRQMKMYINGMPARAPYLADAVVDMSGVPMGIFQNMGGNLDETAMWSRQLSDAEVLALSQVTTNFGQYTSTLIPLSGNARSFSASWTETQPNAVSLEATFNGVHWFALANGQAVDPFAFGLSTNAYSSFRYRVTFNKAADIDDVTFNYATSDATPPSISNVTVVPRASDASIKFQTSEFSTAAIVVNGQTFAAAGSSTAFSIDALGLRPGTAYPYQIRATDAYGNVGTVAGTLTTVGSCLVVDVCGNAKDDDCDGVVDAPGSCAVLNSLVKPDLLGLLSDSVMFGAGHMGPGATVNPGTREVMPRDSDFIDHAGKLSAGFNSYGARLIDAFAMNPGETIEFDLDTSTGYNVLSLDGVNAKWGL